MSSEKRIAANRKNARRSTGPKTPEGKARSSRNARKHGLLSKDITLPEENPGDFRQLLQAYCDDLQPVGETEEFLVHEIATCQWRLERARRSDTGLWRAQMSKVCEYSSTEYDPKDHDDTICLEGLAFYRASHTFTQQARYEATIRRAYYRALDDLRRRQDRRAEQPPPAPAPAANLPESNRMRENYETNPPLPQPAAAPPRTEDSEFQDDARRRKDGEHLHEVGAGNQRAGVVTAQFVEADIVAIEDVDHLGEERHFAALPHGAFGDNGSV
jgi:hypothetical protein